MAEPMTLQDLERAVSGRAAAIRCRRTLEPAGGPGDKVFPPTYAGATYAVEQRRIRRNGTETVVQCVLLDSVQSQANRIEEALQAAVDRGLIQLPLIEVDFSDVDPTGNHEDDERQGRLLDPVGKVTSLQAPHRLADAILRDSFLKQTGELFRQSRIGREIDMASPRNATPLYKYCPTALVLGMWDSTGPKGGLGAKFARALVSEIVGIDATIGIRTSSRIDPLGIRSSAGPVYRSSATATGWTINADEADKENGTPIKIKDGKPSNINHGNVTPSFGKYGKDAEGPDLLKQSTIDVDYSYKGGDNEHVLRNRIYVEPAQAREGAIAPGGVTISYAEQVTTLSLINLRRLRFPLNGESTPEFDDAARTVLAALALCGVTLAMEKGLDLRSRCLLWPTEPMVWEVLDRPGSDTLKFTLDSDAAIRLLKEAVKKAENVGLKWESDPIPLKPHPTLVDLVRRSQQITAKQGAEGN